MNGKMYRFELKATVADTVYKSNLSEKGEKKKGNHSKIS